MISWATLKKYIKPIFIFVIRIAGIVAVFKLCANYDWKNIGQVLDAKNIPVFAGALCLYTVKQMVDAFRSKRMAAALNVPVSYGRLLKFNIQSVAFDFALPIPQAEEFYRFGRLISYTDNKTAAVLAISLRVTGLFATVCGLGATIVFGSLKLNTLFNGVSNFRIYFTVVDIIIALILIFFVYLRLTNKRAEFVNKGLEWIKLVWQFNNDRKYYLAETTALAFLSQLVYATFIYFVCKCYAADVALFKVYLIVPLIYFGGLIPVGIAGLGIKEAVIAWSLQQFGVAPQVAWNIAFVHFIVMVFYLLLGAILLLFERKTAAAIASGN